MFKTRQLSGIARRDFLKAGFGSLVLGAAGGIGTSPFWSKVAAAQADKNDRILVIVELSGGNDGLNTVIPYGDDAYYNARPKLGLRDDKLRIIDDHFAFQKSMSGFERIYKDGLMGIVHGVGYDQPSFSHFSSMAYWHTGAPNSGELYGWLGRLADAMDPLGHANYMVNINDHQSLAVRAQKHVPLVFDDPDKFVRGAFHGEQDPLAALAAGAPGGNSAQDFMNNMALSALNSEQLVRDAWSSYQTPIDYGLVRFGLDRVAALISANFPTKIYYVAYRNNAFDTHVYQADLHERLWAYTADHLNAFLKDVDRIGRADDVVVMAFSEFGRRVAENTSLGTDHGTAGPAFVMGKPVSGGMYGTHPSLTDLDDGNLKYTTDFRRIYSTLIHNWMGYEDPAKVLGSQFEGLNMFNQPA